jgi:CBS-domain-containing membrane protein
MKVHRQVGDVMSRSVISVRPDMGYRRLVELMQEHAVSVLPVADDARRPLGIVSEDGLLAGTPSQALLTGARRGQSAGPGRRSQAVAAEIGRAAHDLAGDHHHT